MIGGLPARRVRVETSQGLSGAASHEVKDSGASIGFWRLPGADGTTYTKTATRRCGSLGLKVESSWRARY